MLMQELKTLSAWGQKTWLMTAILILLTIVGLISLESLRQSTPTFSSWSSSPNLLPSAPLDTPLAERVAFVQGSALPDMPMSITFGDIIYDDKPANNALNI